MTNLYRKPELMEVGSFEEITLTKGGSNHIDSTFTITIPTGLPYGSIPGYVNGIIAAHTS